MKETKTKKAMRMLEEDFRVDFLDDKNGWILDRNGNYIAEAVTKDSENRFRPTEELKILMDLMARAPRMYRLLKRFLEKPGNFNHGNWELVAEIKRVLTYDCGDRG